MHALKTYMNIKQSEYLYNVLRFNGAIEYYPDILYRKFKPGQGLEKKNPNKSLDSQSLHTDSSRNLINALSLNYAGSHT